MKTIFITGSSSGIGKATAKLFHEKGWNVVASMRSPEKETELTDLDNVLVTRLDVQDSASIQSAYQSAIERFGIVDVLLNNAGYGTAGPVEAFSMDAIRRQFEVNVIGLLEVTKTFLPHFRDNKSGILMNVSSIGGKMTFPLVSLYHGTKFAVEGISESLSYELAEFGGKVKIIEPGAIITDFATRSFDMQNDESLTEYQNIFGKLMNAMWWILEVASPASLVAEKIYEAATDGTDTLRYIVWADAEMYEQQRREQDDTTFMNNITSQFDL